ncbi:MAG: fatty acid desaturase family protein [Pseudomonadota bacterium]|jgi:fatty acid desaturase
MPAAPRIDPKEVFSPRDWERLTTPSRWRGLVLVAHCWAMILAGGALFVLFPNPFTYILAVMIIGARQLGLAVLMHDGAHGALHPDPEVNDFIGRWFCGAPTNADLVRYRTYHLQHHKFVQQPEDPDLGLSAPFPISRASFQRKAIRDLTGQTFYKQRVAPIFAAYAEGKAKGRPRETVTKGVVAFFRDFLIVNGVMLAALSLVGLWWAYFALWLVPMASWYPLVTRVRNIAEHACLTDNDDPFRTARTTHAGFIERALVAPYYVNYHCEHHLFMYLPCWRLPEAHRLMLAKGLGAKMELKPSYLDVLRLATSA